VAKHPKKDESDRTCATPSNNRLIRGRGTPRLLITKN
jgi:hypothetical protein